MNPIFPNDDSPETLTAASTLGVSHPPGYPLALLCVRAFRAIPWGGDGFRASLASAFLAAFGAALFALLLARLLEKTSGGPPEKPAMLWTSVFGFLLAFSETYWRNALGAKGTVYHLQILFLLLLAFPLLLPGGRRRWLFAGVAVGLGLSNHWPTQVVLLIGWVPALWMTSGVFKKPDLRCIPHALFGAFLGFTPLLLFAPLRDPFHPALDWGAVDSCGRWLQYVWLKHYDWLRAPLSDPQTWRLFSDRAHEIALFLAREPFPLFLLAVLAAGWHLTKSGRGALAAALSLPVLALAAANLFINRLPAPNPWPLRNHMMASLPFLLAIVAAAVPWNALGRSKIPWGAFLTALTLAMGILSCPARDQSRETLAWRYGLDLMASCPRNAVLFAEEDSDYFTAGYFQGIGRRRPDLDVVTTFLWQEEWGVARWKQAHGNWNLETHEGAAPWDRVGDNIRRAMGALKGKRPLRASISTRFVARHALSEPTPWKGTPYGLTLALEPKTSPAPAAPRVLRERLEAGAEWAESANRLPFHDRLKAVYELSFPSFNK